MGVFAFPLLVAAQQGGEGRPEPVVAGGQGAQVQVIMGDDAARYSDPGNNFFSNVPINELSAKAYRRFHRRFPEVQTGEYWFKYNQGYQVSFLLDQHRETAYYDQHGMFTSSMASYDAKDLPRDLPRDLMWAVHRRFPDYKLNVLTEVNDGQKTFYVLQILNPAHIKVLTVVDGRIDIINELNNGSADIGPAEAVR
jgi:hypothetical protein